MPHSYTQLLYHLVFSTKRREPSWVLGVAAPVRIPRRRGARRGRHGPDRQRDAGPHPHSRPLAPGRRPVRRLRAIKANSSGWIHDTFPELSGFAWQSGYGAFTVSASQADKVRHYIERQQEHHRHRTFQEEFVAFLKAHDIEYDEQYLWD